jgi:hypothetical protein
MKIKLKCILKNETDDKSELTIYINTVSGTPSVMNYELYVLT